MLVPDGPSLRHAHDALACVCRPHRRRRHARAVRAGAARDASPHRGAQCVPAAGLHRRARPRAGRRGRRGGGRLLTARGVEHPRAPGGDRPRGGGPAGRYVGACPRLRGDDARRVPPPDAGRARRGRATTSRAAHAPLRARRGPQLAGARPRRHRRVGAGAAGRGVRALARRRTARRAAARRRRARRGGHAAADPGAGRGRRRRVGARATRRWRDDPRRRRAA